ncbi:hypothetical protein GGX14DRAFT_406017 [Mycena pura]|uniref:Ubiquitin-like protease family profile domain-containing protein n=1 Tax=Mycena pura TaxID=153505 RepID=A0AAD6UV83_9AGAR|nr:hypothetical protein GGX14DRAFT_406017 [Mycena pura]
MAPPAVSASVDLTADDPPFNPADFVGSKKKYPSSDTPAAIQAALDAVLKLPAAHASLIPGPNLPVTEFLKLSFPKKSNALLFSDPASWFSTDAPTTTVECLLSRPIPPRAFLNDLTKAVGQAWFDGCMSIVDHRYNDGRDRVPLWALTWWKAMERMVDDQRMWRKSRDWLTTELGKPDLASEDREALDTAGSLLDTLGWDTKLGTTWTTFNLAMVLGAAWLTDDHIDMMMADLSARVAAEPALVDKLLIAPLGFAMAITNAATSKTYNREDSTLLAQYEEHIKNVGLAQLYFPVNVRANHWIAGLVNFKEGLIGTGKLDHRGILSSPRTPRLNSAIGQIDTAVKLSRSRKKAKELDLGEEDTTQDF